MAYAYFVAEAARWGYAAERDTQLMTGRAITRAINDLYIEGEIEGGVEIIAERPGFQKYFKEFVPRWIAEDNIGSKHGGEEWKESTLLQAMADAVVRRPSSLDEKKLLRWITELVRQEVRAAARAAFVKDPSAYNRTGTILTDEDPAAPALPIRIK